jgi:transcriptional regulator with XRE-family HTH domain
VAYSEVLDAMVLRIWGLLAQQGRTQAWLACQSGCSQKHVSLVLTGRASASPEMLERWAALLGYRFTVRVRRLR